MPASLKCSIPLRCPASAVATQTDDATGTPGRPNVQTAPTGTQNVDALSWRGDRYSIKGVLDRHKTGTIYPDSDERDICSNIC